MARDDAASVEVGGSTTVAVLDNDEGTDGTQVRVVDAPRGLTVAVTAESALRVHVDAAMPVRHADVVYALVRAGRDLDTATVSLTITPAADATADPEPSASGAAPAHAGPSPDSALEDPDEPRDREEPASASPGTSRPAAGPDDEVEGESPQQHDSVLSVPAPVDLTGVLSAPVAAVPLVPELSPSLLVPGLGVAPVDELRATTSVGRPVTVDVPVGGATVVRASDPAGGRVDARRDHVVYTPDGGFSGEDRFELTLSDGRTASVVVDVVPGSVPPEAVDDAVATTAGTPVVVRVLSNDRHVPADRRVSVAAGPGSGSVRVEQDGAITYLPRTGFTGTDRFTYAVTTSTGVSRAQVEVVVLPEHAVDALDDEAVTAPGAPVVVDVRANDVGAAALHVVLTGQLDDEQGTAVVDDGGQVTWTPPQEMPHGLDAVTIPYALTLDAAGTQVLARAVLRVQVRSATELVAVDDVLVLAPGTARPYRVDILANDQVGDSVEISVSCDDDGGFCEISGRQVVVDRDLRPGQRVTFTYTLSSSGSTLTGSDEASVTVIMPPDGPVDQAVAVDDRASVLLGETVSLDVLENDTVPPSYAPEVVSGPEGRADFEHHGEERGWELEYTAPSQLPASGTETITYRLSEQQVGVTASGAEAGAAPTAVVVVDLAAAAATDDVVVLEQAFLGQEVLLDVLANDDAPQGAQAVPTSQIGMGTLEWNPTARKIRLRVVDRSVGSATFTYELRSGEDVLDTAQVTVRIRRALAVPDRVAALPGVPVAIAVLSNDRETEGRTVQVPERSQGGGTLRWDETRRVVVYTMAPGSTGATDRFTYQLGIPFESFVPESSAEVTVERITPPTAPTAVTAERRADGLVVVRWQPPDSDGGSPVTGYRISVSGVASGVSLPATARSAELPGLREDVDGTISVRAVNLAGEGPPAQVPVPRRPSVPRDVRAVGGPSLIALEWRPPLSQGSSPLTGYRVTWDRGGASTGAVGPAGGTHLLPATASRTVLTGLQDGVPYAVSVEALNAVGAGPAARTTATPRTPVLADDRALTTAVAPVDIPVLANDRDLPAGAELSVDALPPGRGRAEVVGGVVRFTPSGPFGRVELTYRVTALGVEMGRGRALVEEVDAVDDAASSPRGRSVLVDLLGNDLVPSGVTVQVRGSAGGALEVVGAGASFTPSPGFVGTATAVYELVADGRVLDAATVTVEVGVRPDAVDDTATVVAGETVDIPVLANDVGATGLTVLLVDPLPARHGLQVLADGVVRHAPPIDHVGPVVFRYALADASGSYDTATVTVEVERARPEAVDDAATTPAQTPVTVDVRANDLRAEGTTVVLTPLPGASLVGGGDVRYAPPAGVSGVVTITYGLSRGGPVLTSARLRVTVEPAPTEPSTTDPSGTRGDPATSPEPEPDPGTEDQGETGTTELTPTPPTEDPRPTPTPTPAISPRPPVALDPVTVVPGGEVRVSGSGCEPGQRVELRVGEDAAGSTTADPDGRFSAAVQAPSDAGRYAVVATCGDRRVQQTVDVVVTVSRAGGAAAATGGAVVVAGLLAFYVLTGSVLVPRGTSVGAPAVADEDEG